MAADDQHNIGQPGSGVVPPQTAAGTGAQAKAKRLSREEARLGEVLQQRYKLTELIGKGGMAAVYKAKDLTLGATVAIKVLLPEVEEESGMVDRFTREAKASAGVNHPNLVKLLNFGQDEDGSNFIVVEYLNGHSLAHLIKEEDQLGVERTLYIFAQICDGLEAAHRKNLIHRDLKPSNVMLINQDDEDDFVKVVDFGLAKFAGGNQSQQLTQTGEVFGSPVYMSPEQCRGLVVDHRSDIYSLGIMMYEALTGKLPLVGDNLVATISKHMNDAPPTFNQARPDLYIPERLEAVVMKALAKLPQDRFASMAEMKAAMEAALPGRLQTEPLASAFRANAPATKTEKPLAKLALIVVIVLVGLIAIVSASAMLTRELVKQSQKSAGTVTKTTVTLPSEPTAAVSSAKPGFDRKVKPTDVRTADGEVNSLTSPKPLPAGDPVSSKPTEKPLPLDLPLNPLPIKSASTSPVTPTQPSQKKTIRPALQKEATTSKVISKGSPVRKATAKSTKSAAASVAPLQNDASEAEPSSTFSQTQQPTRHGSRHLSDEDLMYDFQSREGKYSRPQRWSPPVSGTVDHQGK